MRSKNSLNSSTGTRLNPFGSRARSQRFLKSSPVMVKISRKHLRFKNWSHSILTFSFEVSIPSADINRLFTSLNLSASEIVKSKKTLREIEGPSHSRPVLALPSPPSSVSLAPYSKVSFFLFLLLSAAFFYSSCSIVIKLQNSASSWKTCYHVM